MAGYSNPTLEMPMLFAPASTTPNDDELVCKRDDIIHAVDTLKASRRDRAKKVSQANSRIKDAGLGSKFHVRDGRERCAFNGGRR